VEFSEDLRKSRKCSRPGCNERFPLVTRGGRNSIKARAGRKQTLHQGRRYCSDTCRKLASKARLQPSPSGAKKAPKVALATTPLSTVTSAPSTIEISRGYEEQKSGRAPLGLTFGGYTVVPDSKWPNMYRVRSPDGTLTDMVNLTRARDAALSFSAIYQSSRSN
jgi:hypothetical protein